MDHSKIIDTFDTYQLVNAPPCPTPIQSSSYPTGQTGPAVRLLECGSIPNSDSAPWMQAGPVANSPPVPNQSANMGDLVVEFRKKFDRLAYDKFGVMPKHRTYVKPYPKYFDLQPYPPFFRKGGASSASGRCIRSLLHNPIHLAIESLSFPNLMGWIASRHWNKLVNIWLN